MRFQYTCIPNVDFKLLFYYTYVRHTCRVFNLRIQKEFHSKLKNKGERYNSWEWKVEYNIQWNGTLKDHIIEAHFIQPVDRCMFFTIFKGDILEKKHKVILKEEQREQSNIWKKSFRSKDTIKDLLSSKIPTSYPIKFFFYTCRTAVRFRSIFSQRQYFWLIQFSFQPDSLFMPAIFTRFYIQFP